MILVQGSKPTGYVFLTPQRCESLFRTYFVPQSASCIPLHPFQIRNMKGCNVASQPSEYATIFNQYSSGGCIYTVNQSSNEFRKLRIMKCILEYDMEEDKQMMKLFKVRIINCLHQLPYCKSPLHIRISNHSSSSSNLISSHINEANTIKKCRNCNLNGIIDLKKENE